MNYIKDFQYVSKNSMKKTYESFKKNWLIIFTGIVYTIISMLVFTVVGFIFRGPLSIISGFITYFIQSTIISNYLYLLYNIINYSKFNLNDFKQGFMYFIWKVYGVLFIIYLGQLLLSMLSNVLGSSAYIVNTVIGLIVLVLFNPIPETIYLKSLNPQETIMYTIDFMKENWLNWIVTNAIFMGAIYLITGELLTGLFNTGLRFNYGFSVRAVLTYILGQIIFSIMMVYRGHLYKVLSTSTMRKRMFMNKF